VKLKVMLVDDELLVRLGIKALIDWDKHDFEFIGDAGDGEKALELMERQAPDILLTDIVMPRMDGLALIEAVKRRYPRMLVIVLSSHNEFDYVRQAMKLGAQDYLLKTSLKPSELLDLLIEASRKLAAEQAEAAVPAAQPVAHADDRKASRARLLARLLKGEPAAMAGENESDLAEELPPGRVLLMLRAKRARDGAMEQSAARLLEHLIESELGGMLDSEPLSVRDNELVALLAVRSGSGGEPSPEPEQVVEQLANAAGRLLGLSLQAQTSGELADWEEAADFYTAAQAALSDSGVREPSREDIKRLIDYMRANIAQELSLKQAADMIKMSESYLSTIFKKETGLGFTDWINVMRVEEAARYLEHSSLPSYSIAEKVGYENINYFGRIFKKLKGVSPQHYRAQRQRRSMSGANERGEC